jgi:hypothetical protein
VLKKIDSDASEKIILHRKTFLQHCASALNRQRCCAAKSFFRKVPGIRVVRRIFPLFSCNLLVFRDLFIADG